MCFGTKTTAAPVCTAGEGSRATGGPGALALEFAGEAVLLDLGGAVEGLGVPSETWVIVASRQNRGPYSPSTYCASHSRRASISRSPRLVTR